MYIHIYIHVQLNTRLEGGGACPIENEKTLRLHGCD